MHPKPSRRQSYIAVSPSLQEVVPYEPRDPAVHSKEARRHGKLESVLNGPAVHGGPAFT